MDNDKFYLKIQHLLSYADIDINGDRPWDIQVHNKNLYPRVLAHGSLGLGESYMDGWWDCERIDEFICRIFKANIYDKINPRTECLSLLKARLFNLQKPSACFIDCRHHYDIGNDIYQCMLDRLRIYSCGYWKNTSCLDDAQEKKLDLICRKLFLKPGMRVLDIGCGWGGTAKFIAENYHVKVVGITVSEKQARFAEKFCKGLPVEIRLEDYRSLKGVFDRIVSVGMIEHVGYKNYKTFMRVVRRCLKENGIFVLQTIGSNYSMKKADPWIRRYIFPNSVLPSAKQINDAFENLFVLEDWHNFGPDYDKTLMHWFQNFQNGRNDLKDKYGERFCRMWKYYLLSCAGTFRARVNQLWQIVLSPKGVSGGYYAPR
ncbi:MAG: cyclopropane fatty acyl phospholipid synthase [Deltaproteobacteria bacterium]|nr:cyclopropane fatty acyl phospholipid synthase [Deltaproteobacteria bacterium]